VAVATGDLCDAALSPTELALVAQRAENEFAGVPCGVMDQLASMLGREGHALLIDTRSLDVEPVPFPPAGLAALVIDTRVRRELAGGEYAERRATCEEAARTMGVRTLRDVTLDELEGTRSRLDPVVFRRARHVVTENARVLVAAEALRAADPDRLGAAMAASHRSLRSDFEVSTAELDLAVEAATRAGAIGARMTGAGFGGSAIALVSSDAVAELETAVVRAFVDTGLDTPGFHRVFAADGAGRAGMEPGAVG